MINRKNFFNSIRPLFGTLSKEQVSGMEDILNEWELWVANGWVDNDPRKLAYICATSYHETGAKMQPVEEIGKGKRHPYGKIDPKTGKAYYGRGDVQLTWADNYTKMGKLIGVDLYNNPDLALDSKNSKAIMFEGMLTGKSFQGDFTGKHLNNYFNKTTNDPLGARRIINGTDKAKLIASHYEKFLKAITS